jgi:DNA-binding MarR family transcriptional regulator
MNNQAKNMPKRPELAAALLVAGREMSARIILFHQALVGQFGLNATDHKCLDIAKHEEVITAGRLAELTGLTTGAITAALDRLERAGFARRERHSEDRRKVVVRVLPEGQKKLAPFFASFAQSMARMHENYTAAELALLLDYQKRCIHVLKAHAKEIKNKATKEST